MKWIARLGEREETVEIGPSVSNATESREVMVRVGDDAVNLNVGEGPFGCAQGRLAPSRGGAGNIDRSTRETSVIHGGRQYEVSAVRLSANRYRVSVNGRHHEVTVDDRLGYLARRTEGAGGGRGGTVTAYMPGKVVTVLVEEGSEVKVGEGVVVLEAMKMENEIQAEIDGVVSKIHVHPGQAVEGGDELFELVVSG